MKKIIVYGISALLFAGCDFKPDTKKDSGGKAGPVVLTPNTKRPDGKGATLAPPANPGEAPGLRDPSQASEKAPDVYKAKFVTTKGDFEIEVTRSWAPNGADRLYNLVKVGYFTDIAFFRNIAGFMVQFGISGDPSLNTIWRSARIQDDAVTQSNAQGNVTFATAGPNTRTSQLFINLANNSDLDGQGFAPIGKVVSGMDVVNALYNGYGEGAPRGMGPDQGQLQKRGNEYLKESFPQLDYIKSASIVP
jgi:peptidyl-prolyl cis-trans isomerase A (cyclophilin A)